MRCSDIGFSDTELDWASAVRLAFSPDREGRAVAPSRLPPIVSRRGVAGLVNARVLQYINNVEMVL